jgi:hypothetical protein
MIVLWGGIACGIIGRYISAEYRSCNGKYLFRVRDLEEEKRGGDSPVSSAHIFGEEDEVPWSREQFLASLYRIGDGTKEFVWGTYLPYPPRYCYITNDGRYVVTVESHHWVGAGERGMQIFGPNGGLIRACPREYFARVLDDPEFVPFGKHSGAPYSWHLTQYTGFTRDQSRFIVTRMDEKTFSYWNPRTREDIPTPRWPLPERLIVFDLETGSRVAGDPDDDPVFEWGMIAVWIEMLQSGDAEERLEGARGLALNLSGARGAGIMFGRRGNWENHALPVLEDSLDDPDMRVRSEVLAAIHRIDPKKGTTVANEYARSESPEMRRLAVRFLAEPWSREGFSLLGGLLQDPDERTAQRAAERFHNRLFVFLRKNGREVDLLRDYLRENGRPGDDVEGNIAVLAAVADGTVSLGESVEESAAVRREAVELAQELDVRLSD